MLSRLSMVIHRNKEILVGFETAIILVAFVVMAVVFAHTVLSTGLVSAMKGQEAICSIVDEPQSAIETEASVVASEFYQLDDCEDAWATV